VRDLALISNICYRLRMIIASAFPAADSIRSTAEGSSGRAPEAHAQGGARAVAPCPRRARKPKRHGDRHFRQLSPSLDKRSAGLARRYCPASRLRPADRGRGPARPALRACAIAPAFGSPRGALRKMTRIHRIRPLLLSPIRYARAARPPAVPARSSWSIRA
jgi:hypothetical protein